MIMLFIYHLQSLMKEHLIFRFISSLDNELSNLEKVFDKLDLELKDNRIQKVKKFNQ